MAKLGMGELILILVVALICLGPDKLPQVGRSLGKGIRAVKGYLHDLTRDLEDMEELKEIQKDVTDIRKDLRSVGTGLEKSLRAEEEEIQETLDATRREIRDGVEKMPEQPVQSGTTEAEAPAEEPAAEITTEEEK